ncbi:MAG: methyltransferase domain-containing protein [Pseudonocardiaceae bacterium]
MPEQQNTYIHGHHDSVLRSHRWRTAGNSAAYLIPHLRSGQRLLDVGCGPGTITLDLARLVAPGSVVGLDKAVEPLQRAAADAADQRVHNVTFAVGDVYHLPYPDDAFDIVHAHQVLQHLADPVVALGELRRVCRAGGYVAVRDADYAAMTWYPPDPRLDRWLDMYRRVARSNHAEPDAGRRLLSWTRTAGFAETTASATVWCYATAVERAWWGGLWAERVTSSALAGQALALHLATRQDLADMAAGWRHWSEQDDGWFAVLHGEVLCRC